MGLQVLLDDTRALVKLKLRVSPTCLQTVIAPPPPEEGSRRTNGRYCPPPTSIHNFLFFHPGPQKTGYCPPTLTPPPKVGGLGSYPPPLEGRGGGGTNRHVVRNLGFTPG